MNEDQEEVVMKELDDEDEVVETGIEEVMEGSAVETDGSNCRPSRGREAPADNGGEDDILSQLSFQWAIPLTMKTKTIYKEGER